MTKRRRRSAWRPPRSWVPSSPDKARPSGVTSLHRRQSPTRVLQREGNFGPRAQRSTRRGPPALGPQVTKLLRIADGADGLDESLGDVEGDDQDGPPIVAQIHRPRLSVDLRQPHPLGAQLRPPLPEPEQYPHDPFAPVHRVRERRGLPAAIAVRDHVGGEQAREAFEVTIADRLEEPPGELLPPPS